MPNEMQGFIDITAPLTWAEVGPTGFMAMVNGVPQVPPGRWVELVATETLVDHAQGTLHRFTFGRLVAATADIPDAQREAFRAQVQEIFTAFPTHTFGTTSKVIRFRGDQLDDQWRVGTTDGLLVRRQNASISWAEVVPAKK